MKVSRILLISIFIVLIAGIISAQEITISDDYNWWDNILYNLKKIGLFTAEGQSRQCSINADYTWYTTAGQSISKSEFLSKCGGPSALIDVFTTSWNFIDEYRIEIIGSGINTGSSDKIVEIYCCPYAPCSSNSGCSSPPASNYGTTCNTIYGSCYSSQPTHTTKVYQCVSGNWNLIDTVSYGEYHWCSTSGYNNYISQTGNEGCYASAPSGWCVALCKTQGQSCTLSSQCCSGLACQNFGCYPPSVCGDGICQSTETATSCPADCGTAPVCGNGDCEAGETQGATYECEADCGPWNGDTCASQSGNCRLSCETGESNIGTYDCFNLFGIGMTCCKASGNGNGNSNGNGGKSFTYDELNSASGYDLADAVCKSSSNCPTNSSCKSVEGLGLSDEKINAIRQRACDLRDSFLGFIFGNDAYNSCTCAPLACSEDHMNEYFSNTYGICIQGGGTTSLDFLKFLAFMDIDGDGDKDGTDGMFIGVALLFLLVIILKR